MRQKQQDRANHEQHRQQQRVHICASLPRHPGRKQVGKPKAFCKQKDGQDGDHPSRYRFAPAVLRLSHVDKTLVKLRLGGGRDVCAVIAAKRLLAAQPARVRRTGGVFRQSRELAKEWQGVPKVEAPEVDLVAKGEVDGQREPERQHHETEVRVLGRNRQEISHVTPHLVLWAVRKPHILGNATLRYSDQLLIQRGNRSRPHPPQEPPSTLILRLAGGVRALTYVCDGNTAG